MRCHVCDAPAAFAPEHEQVKVGLCRRHMRAYLAALDDAGSLQDLEGRVERD